MKKIIILIVAIVFAPLAHAHRQYGQYDGWGHHHHHHHGYNYPKMRYYQPAPPVVYAPPPTFQFQYSPPAYNVHPTTPYYQAPMQPNYYPHSRW